MWYKKDFPFKIWRLLRHETVASKKRELVRWIREKTFEKRIIFKISSWWIIWQKSLRFRLKEKLYRFNVEKFHEEWRVHYISTWLMLWLENILLSFVQKFHKRIITYVGYVMKQKERISLSIKTKLLKSISRIIYRWENTTSCGKYCDFKTFHLLV